MRNIRQLLEVKGHEVWSIGPHESVLSAIERMAQKGIGALLVMQDGQTMGVISERDYARKVILQGKSSSATPVSDIMSSRVVYAQPDQTIEECMAVMTDRHIRHLPVLDGDQLAGLISINDLVRAIIADQRFRIEQLELYISG
jgi:CBS domain-containing protein